MTSFEGTIFHLGMISSTRVKRFTTTGCGFTFSDIYFIIKHEKKKIQIFVDIENVKQHHMDRSPYTLARQGLPRPKMLGPFGEVGGPPHRPLTPRIKICTCLGILLFLKGRQAID